MGDGPRVNLGGTAEVAVVPNATVVTQGTIVAIRQAARDNAQRSRRPSIEGAGRSRSNHLMRYGVSSSTI